MADIPAAGSGGPFVTNSSAQGFIRLLKKQPETAAYICAALGVEYPEHASTKAVAELLSAVADHLHPAGATPQVEQVAAEILEVARDRWFEWIGSDDPGWKQVERVKVKYSTDDGGEYQVSFSSSDFSLTGLYDFTSLADLRTAALAKAVGMPTERPADPEPEPAPEPEPPAEPEAPAGEG